MKTKPLFFKNDQIRAFFRAARPTERGMLALLVFAGVRMGEATRLTAEDINLAERRIYLRAYIAKSGRTRFLETPAGGDPFSIGRPGLPRVLWEWLERYPFGACPWLPLHLRLRRVAGQPWIPNGLRSTAAIKYCAMFGRLPAAELLGHFTLDLVNRHILSATTRASAEEFYAISPDSIAELN
jgi:integrase